MTYAIVAYVLSGMIWVLYLLSVRRRLGAALERRRLGAALERR